MKLEAVFFDAEGTLLHIHPSVGEVYAGVLARFGLRVPSGELDQRIRERWPAFKRYFRTFSPSDCLDTWRRIFREALSPWLKDPEEVHFLAVYEAFSRPEAFRLAPGTERALRFLKDQGIKTAVVSNWDERLLRLLKAFNLSDYFEGVFVACEMGLGKPDPEFYRRVCKTLGVEPGRALMVGDDPELDEKAAKRAGLRARLYRGEDLYQIIKEEVEKGVRERGISGT